MASCCMFCITDAYGILIQALCHKYIEGLLPIAEQWVRGSRTAAHLLQDTTGACKGFHSALKMQLRRETPIEQ